MKKTILIVDDNEGDRVLVQEAILDAGMDCDIVMAESAKGCFDVIKKRKIDLIVLDILMPSMDGTVVCGALKYDDEYKDIPVILFSSVDTKATQDISRVLKADDYIVKKEDLSGLVNRIKELLKI